jgi:multicomponent Na+:H+ antiporter subunit G
MSAVFMLEAALVSLAVAVQLACVLGVLVARSVLDRLHFTGPAAMLAPILVAVAVLLERRFGQVGVKALLVALTLIVTNPVIVHATARAARIRELGAWEALPDEAASAEEP